MFYIFFIWNIIKKRKVTLYKAKTMLLRNTRLYFKNFHKYHACEKNFLPAAPGF